MIRVEFYHPSLGWVEFYYPRPITTLRALYALQQEIEYGRGKPCRVVGDV